jgi:hypothetical protein
MKAELLADERHIVGEDGFAELRLWRVPEPVRGSKHRYKYSLAYIVRDVCVLRYDNEAGKGDHKHVGEHEVAYLFVSLEKLLADFWAAVNAWREA